MRAPLLAVAGIALLAFPARADDDECSPPCKLGFECTKGQCVAEQCTPKCRTGFSCIAGECKSECEPACRTGYMCIHGECKSPCNPPCGSSERCTPDGECVRMSKQRWNESSNDSGEPVRPKETSTDDEHLVRSEEVPKGEKSEQLAPYAPSSVRLYAGPAAWAIFSYPAEVGATVAARFYPEASRLFFFGVRASFLGDSSGFLWLVDGSIGLQPVLYARHSVGIHLVIDLAFGGAQIVPDAYTGIPAVTTFHLAGRIGPCFDFGAFTMELLAAPALYAAKGSFGAFESIFELGVRL